jgi:hypothetical protein
MEEAENPVKALVEEASLEREAQGREFPCREKEDMVPRWSPKAGSCRRLIRRWMFRQSPIRIDRSRRSCRRPSQFPSHFLWAGIRLEDHRHRQSRPCRSRNLHRWSMVRRWNPRADSLWCLSRRRRSAGLLDRIRTGHRRCSDRPRRQDSRSGRIRCCCRTRCRRKRRLPAEEPSYQPSSS